MADEYGRNVWEPDLPEVWEGIRGRRLVREEGRPFPRGVGAPAGRAWGRLLSQRGEPFFVRLPMPDA